MAKSRRSEWRRSFHPPDLDLIRWLLDLIRGSSCRVRHRLCRRGDGLDVGRLEAPGGIVEELQGLSQMPWMSRHDVMIISMRYTREWGDGRLDLSKG
ncbi:hypothetical protein TorRG33x02_147060 [Trema orientale]|uniref:Uncharacterized protein n=1 Tax=Trema orientale TaxID=63057 RepID=A0A2P5EVK2_TREOI|nr:hypothetical protein TorRG33x02_147060 [Trema orientale]